MDWKMKAKENESLAIGLRRHLHMHPELSGLEFETVKFIMEKLDEFGVPHVEVPGGGVLGFLGDEGRGRTLLLRADMDALPIQESEMNMKLGKACVSKVPGACHACGHDAHTAMLLAAGKILKENELELNGRVILFFERGEETSNNIVELIRHIDREKLRIDAAHAIHMDSNAPCGMFMVEEGPRQAGSLTLEATIHGKGGHGSRPDRANSPLDAFVSAYSSAYEIRLRCVSPYDTLTFSIGKVQCGLGPNTIPDSLSFSGTVRYYSEEAGRRFGEEFYRMLASACEARNLTFVSRPMSLGLPVYNNPKMAQLIKDSIASQLGAERLAPPRGPSMGSESFSLLSTLYPSAIIGLGCGNDELGMTAGIHTPQFDLDEASLVFGIEETVSFAINFLRSKEDLPFERYKGTVEQLLEGR
jgi:amidohydrolase